MREGDTNSYRKLQVQMFYRLGKNQKNLRGVATTPPPLYVQGLKGLAHASEPKTLQTCWKAHAHMHAYRDIDAERLSSTKFLGIFQQMGGNHNNSLLPFFKKFILLQCGISPSICEI